MVVLDLIRRHHIGIDIFTLDTGRLPEETYALMHQVDQVYGRCYETFHPDSAAALQALVRERGINGFYQSIENRKACCGVRKVEPLTRALSGRRTWVTGLRAQQGVSRAAVERAQPGRGVRCREVQPAARLDRTAGSGVHPGRQRALQCTARPALSEYWLRALHARDRGG